MRKTKKTVGPGVGPLASRDEPPLATAAALGAFRAEGLLSARAAFNVCYIGSPQADRITTVPEREHGIGVSLLEFCRGWAGPDCKHVAAGHELHSGTALPSRTLSMQHARKACCQMMHSPTTRARLRRPCLKRHGLHRRARMRLRWRFPRRFSRGHSQTTQSV